MINSFLSLGNKKFHKKNEIEATKWRINAPVLEQNFPKVVIVGYVIDSNMLDVMKTLNPNQAGLFVQATGRRGVESAHGTFWASTAQFVTQISQIMVSNETWHLHTPIKILSNILWTVVS